MHLLCLCTIRLYSMPTKQILSFFQWHMELWEKLSLDLFLILFAAFYGCTSLTWRYFTGFVLFRNFLRGSASTTGCICWWWSSRSASEPKERTLPVIRVSFSFICVVSWKHKRYLQQTETVSDLWLPCRLPTAVAQSEIATMVMLSDSRSHLCMAETMQGQDGQQLIIYTQFGWQIWRRYTADRAWNSESPSYRWVCTSEAFAVNSSS